VPVSVTHKINQNALHALLTNPRGGVVKDLLRRGVKVQNRARVLLSGTDARHPKRVDTGKFRSSVLVTLFYVGGQPRVRIGTVDRRARWIHGGTGVYGPHRARIVPTSRRALRFRVGSKTVIVKSVKGMKPNPFLADALIAAQD